jgi:hypothetical protein
LYNNLSNTYNNGSHRCEDTSSGGCLLMMVHAEKIETAVALGTVESADFWWPKLRSEN